MSHPNSSDVRRTGPVVLALVAAAALGFGNLTAVATGLRAEMGITPALAGISLVPFIVSIVLTAAAIALSRVPIRARVTAAILAAVGFLLTFLVGFLGDISVRLGILAAAILLVAPVLAGLIVALGLRGSAFAWLALLLVPAVIGALAPGFAVVLIAQVLMAVVAALILGLGLLRDRSRPARKAQRDAAAAERGANAEQQELAQRADEIRKWEEAYALAHDGEKPPAGFMPQLVRTQPAGSVNTIAVLALVFAILGSIVGLVLGYVARAQIRRTGEGGAGLALAAIIIGWVEIGLGVAFLVLYAVLIAVAAH